MRFYSRGVTWQKIPAEFAGDDRTALEDVRMVGPLQAADAARDHHFDDRAQGLVGLLGFFHFQAAGNYAREGDGLHEVGETG